MHLRSFLVRVLPLLPPDAAPPRRPTLLLLAALLAGSAIAALPLYAADAPAAPPAALPQIDSPAAARQAQQAAALALHRPITWTNPAGMQFQLIPAGSFVMGSARDADNLPHAVTITEPFYLGRTEVTRGQWQAVTGKEQSNYYPGENRPINYICWYDAQDFLTALNKKDPRKYRLPTEAQWEYAARAGVTGPYPGGESVRDLESAAWFDDNSHSQLHDAAGKQANALGLYDMLGNVWEWCDDFYDPQFARISPLRDPTGPEKTNGRYRVLRGGSAFHSADHCTLTHRDYYEESRAAKFMGFRVLLPASAVPEDNAAPAPAAPAK